MPPTDPEKSGWIKIVDGSDFLSIQVDLIQMDDYPADSRAISLTAFLCTSIKTIVT